MRAHPRSRGENAVVRWQEPNRRGSSPLTRGKQCCCPCRSQRAGLIPAHAGKTPSRWSRTGRAPAHPRSRGENPTGARASTSASGSSPLTRGKRIVPVTVRAEPRLIPAHAGKTQPPFSSFCCIAAHPRSRGENSGQVNPWSPIAGSSPLTRGKRIAKIAKRALGRLIPAHAGKTPSVVLPGDRVRAHPRSRGENASSMPRARLIPGSSPLTRGKPTGEVVFDDPLRLIPAHAGKTDSTRFFRLPAPAHPRSRGENILRSRKPEAKAGSSPLTRGKRVRLPFSGVASRLIPAHAGKTLPFGAKMNDKSAHPRSRGENAGPQLPAPRQPGSSPLTRGKHIALQRGQARRRLIPAHAGKTTARTPSGSRSRAHPRSRGEN